jgi:hypothetical protein
MRKAARAAAHQKEQTARNPDVVHESESLEATDFAPPDAESI